MKSDRQYFLLKVINFWALWLEGVQKWGQIFLSKILPRKHYSTLTNLAQYHVMVKERYL